MNVSHVRGDLPDVGHQPNIKQYLALRNALAQEKQAIESRLKEIAQVLGTATSENTRAAQFENRRRF